MIEPKLERADMGLQPMLRDPFPTVQSQGWRGNPLCMEEVVLDIDDQSSVIMAGDEETHPIVEIETRVNVIGRIWSVNAFPDGQGISRWSITILDSSGAMELSHSSSSFLFWRQASLEG